MRKAAFVVDDGGKSVEITVISLPSQAANMIVANVNRWRGQLGLPPAGAKELAAEIKTLPVGDAIGSYVTIVGPKDHGPPTAIFGVIAPRGDQVWFVKMRGDAALARREQPHFEAFVKSIQFGSAN